MDPVTMIVTALAAGAAKGAGESASTAVTDAYRALKAGLARVFGGNAPAELVLAQHGTDPDAWQGPLTKLVTETGADRDEQILTAARKLLELSDSSGSRAGTYVVNAGGANIANIGDHARQNNTFGAVPGPASDMKGRGDLGVQW
ncbi:hypothetical protein ACIP5Y_19230 [Nocardia sp. NPDC088792]|uniref:hypothetical protein n=1 Tax=Nocardia sp. NPDC088792 TaxID=3364332 RepID=UPI00382FA918